MYNKMIAIMLLTVSFIDGSEAKYKAEALQKMRDEHKCWFESFDGIPSAMVPRIGSIDEYIAKIGKKHREAYVAYMMGSERFDKDEEFKQYKKDHALEIAEIGRKFLMKCQK